MLSSFFIKVVFPIISFWLIVHTLNHFLSRRQQRTLLPTNVRSTGRKRRGYNVALTPLTLTISTTSLNTWHSTLISSFKRRRVGGFWKLTTAFYSTGRIACIALIFFIWISLLFLFTSRLFHLFVPATAPHFTTGLAKRDEDSALLKRDLSTISIRPLLPGITFPLSKTPLLLLTVLVCQVVHEAGHFLAGAL